MAMQKIKKGDEVIVIAGRDKGRIGNVLSVHDDGRAIVDRVNIVKKHQRGNPNTGVTGGIIDKEAPIQVSNLAIYNAKTKKADRVGFKVEKDGTKVRVYKSSGDVIEEKKGK